MQVDDGSVKYVGSPGSPMGYIGVVAPSYSAMHSDWTDTILADSGSLSCCGGRSDNMDMSLCTLSIGIVLFGLSTIKLL